jgi:hypothetical protein
MGLHRNGRIVPHTVQCSICIIWCQRTRTVSDIGTDFWIKVLSLLQIFQHKMHDACTLVLVNKLGFRGLFCKQIAYESNVAPVSTKHNYLCIYLTVQHILHIFLGFGFGAQGVGFKMCNLSTCYSCSADVDANSLWRLCLPVCCLSKLSKRYVHSVCKGKAIPLQALAGPEGSRRLRLPAFVTIGR